MKSRLSTRYITMTAMLSAIATLLMFLDFPLLSLFPSFLKYDFSDMPALIAAFTLSPFAGVAAELIKNVIHLTVTRTGGVGELANFIVGTAFVLPAGLIYKRIKTRRGALLGMLAGTVSMTVIGAVANYYITIPFYSNIMPIESIIAMCAAIVPAIDSVGKMILYTFVPFNIFKGVTISILTFIVYKRISLFIKGRNIF